MISAVAPVWDGNETWLVLGGGGLMAAFPLAYSILLPALYAPIIAMLLALIFRGVAFEFRHRHPRHKGWWTLRLRARLLCCDLCARAGARRLHPGHSCRRPRLCRRLVRLAHGVQRLHRPRAPRRLRAAWRLLPDHEDGRSVAGAHVYDRAAARRDRACGNRRRRALGRRSLVRRLPRAGSRGRTSRCFHRFRWSSSRSRLGSSAALRAGARCSPSSW